MNNIRLSDVSNIAQIAGALALIMLFVQIRINQKQLFGNTIVRCLETFQKIEIYSEVVDEKKMIQYVDLVGEELFYMQRDYIPKDVAFEWLDGMLDILPVTDKSGKLLNESNCHIYYTKNLDKILGKYPRIKNAFSICSIYDFDNVYNESKNERDIQLRASTRKLIVSEIFENIKRFEF